MAQPNDVTQVQEIKLDMQLTEPGGAAPPYVEPVPVPEAIADGLASIQLINGILHLALYAERQSFADRSNVRLVVSRIAMTPMGANLIAESIKRVLAQMVTDGFIPPMPEFQTTKI